MNKGTYSDIALVHPPHDFTGEKYAIFPAPWNLSHIQATSYVGKYPVGPEQSLMPLGFSTMKNFIESNSDYTVNIYNLALLKSNIPAWMLKKFMHVHKEDKSVLSDLADTMYPGRIISALKRIKADLFGVDLHWLNFSQGAIQILKLLKQIHPRSHTVVGGMTASYFKDEIMNLFSCVDFLIAGDGSVPLLKLIRQIKDNRDFSGIPNLLYRENGKIKKGKKHPLSDFKYAQNDERLFFPILPTARGCPLECITCGGSKYSSSNLCNYKKIHTYSVESIMKKLATPLKTPEGKLHIPLVHDPFFTLGRKKWETLLDEIKKNRLNITFTIEFFLPHSKSDIFNIAEKIPGSTIDISPESMDADIRAIHRNIRYSNKALIMNMDTINNIDSLSMHVSFMAGLAKETGPSVDRTLFFIKNFYKKLRTNVTNLIRYNELPFIDPGSLAFDFPDKYGYKLINKSFLSHFESFKMPIYKYQINYRTRNRTRDQLFDLFLYVRNEMNRVYYENDIIDKALYNRATRYNNLLKKYSSEYDKVLSGRDAGGRARRFEKIGNLFRGELEEKYKVSNIRKNYDEHPYK